MTAVSSFTVAAALAKANSTTTPMNISDTGSNIAANFDQLTAISKKITNITATTPLTISLAQYVKDKAIVSKITTTSTVTVTDVTTSSIADVLKNTKYIDNIVVTTAFNDINANKLAINSAITKAASAIKITGYVIKDSLLNVSTHLDQLNSLGTQLANIVLTDAKPTSTIKVSAGQFVKDQKVIDFILKQGPTVSVSDTASNVASNLDKINANINKVVGGIFIKDSINPLSVTENQLTQDTAALKLIKSAYSLGITQASASFVSPTTYANKITSVSVLDTSANISKNLTKLNALGAKLTDINISDVSNPLKLSVSQLTDNTHIASLLNKIQSSYSISISDASIANIAKITANSLVKYAYNTDVYLVDSAAQVYNNLGNLETVFTTSNYINLKGITLTDITTPTIKITSDQFFNNADILNLISSPYALTISGVSADDLTDILKNLRVSYVAINDTADNIASAFDKLNTNASKLSGITVNLSDTKTPYPISLSSTQFISDNAALGLLKGSYTLGITNALANFNTLSNAATYATHIASVSVKDTSAHIIDNLDALNSLGVKLIDVIQTDPGNTPLQITAAQLSADIGVLNNISTNFSVDVSNVLAAKVDSVLNNSKINFIINSVSVSDTNVNIKVNLDTLETNVSSINALTINDSKFSMVITQDQLANDIDVLNLLAKSNPVVAFKVDLPVLTSSSQVFDVDGANGHINFILHSKTTGTPSDTNFGVISHFTGQDKISFASQAITPLVIQGNVASSSAGLAHIEKTTGVATFSGSDNTLALQIVAVEKAISQTSASQGAIALWNNGLDSYAFISDSSKGVTAGDDLIKLTGVDVSHLHLVNGIITYS